MESFKYINLRVSPEFHQLVKIKSAEEGISMTEYINNKINKKETPEKKPQPFKPNISNTPTYNTGEGGQLNEYNPQPKKDKKK